MFSQLCDEGLEPDDSRVPFLRVGLGGHGELDAERVDDRLRRLLARALDQRRDALDRQG